MTDEELESLSALADECGEFDFLPDLAERQATLRRANLALERARALLAQVTRLDVPSPAMRDNNQSPGATGH